MWFSFSAIWHPVRACRPAFRGELIRRLFGRKAMQPYATLYLGEETHFIRFSPEGSALLTLGSLSWTKNGWGNEPHIRVWDVGRGIKRFSAGDDWSHPESATICFSPDGRFFAADQPCRTLSVWDVRTGEGSNVSPHICIGQLLQFSPDGRFLLFQDRSVNHPDYLIFLATRAREFCRIEATTRQVAFAADGRSFATAHGKMCRPSTDSQRFYCQFRTAGRPVVDRTYAIQGDSVVFSPDLSTYAIVDPDRRGFSL